MAAQALSFCCNFWGSSNYSSSSLQHQQNQHLNPNTVSFPQRKRPRSSSSLSFSSNTYNNPCFNSNPVTPQTNNTNPFYTTGSSYYTNPNHLFPTDVYATNPSFFDPPSSQNLFPFHHDNTNPLCPPPQGDHGRSLEFFDGYSSTAVPDAVLDFSSLEDQILLAPFLAEPDQDVMDLPALPQENQKESNYVISADQPKKPCGDGGGIGTVVSPQSVAARERRRKITERTSDLGRLIPGGNKMSTAEMFQAAYKYVKFLQAQVSVLQLLRSSNQEMNEEEQLHIKELQVLASPIIQEYLYSQEKCLVPKKFVDRTLANHQDAVEN